MKNRSHLLASLAMTSLLLSGCAAAAGTTGAASAPPSAVPSASEAENHGAHDHGAGATSAHATPAADGPSEAALMVCGDQSMANVTSILALKSAPHTINSWANSTFTCTYHLPDGDLVISVQEAADPAAARTYFEAMQALAKDATPIKGLANLGFPAYETADGSAVFQKDNMILHVDAADLPAAVGPNGVTPAAFAYQLSTTILACWVEHP